jgi:hypothetical protein
MISDADPMEVFGINNRTGNEIIIALFGVGRMQLILSSHISGKDGNEPINSRFMNLMKGTNNSHMCSIPANYEQPDTFSKSILVSGDYPIDKESAVQEGLNHTPSFGRYKSKDGKFQINRRWDKETKVR